MQTKRINRWACFIAVIIFSFGVTHAQNNFQLKQIWKKHIRGTTGDELINGISLTPEGNVLVAGRYTTQNLGPSIDVNFPGNIHFLGQTGGYADGFAINYAANGNVNWAQRYNRNNNDAYFDIAVAPNNTPYAVGGDNTGFSGFEFANTIVSQFNVTTGVITTNTSSNGAIVNRFNSLAIDQGGFMYAGGLYSANPDFNLGRGASVFAGAATSHQDAVLVKHNANRVALWAKRFGSTGYDEINRVVVKGNTLYIVGSFTGKVDFNPSTAAADTFFLQTPSASVSNAFILKLDTAGNFLNVWTIASTTQNVLNDIAVNDAGEIFVAGYYGGTVDVNPAAGTNNITAAGMTDALLVKLDVNGNLVWHRSFGGLQDDRFTRLVIGNTGDIYTCGYFSSASVDYGTPGQNILNNAGAAGTADGVIAGYTSSGNNFIAHRIGGTGNDFINALAIDSLLQLYVAVNFSSTIETEFIAGTSSITTQGGGTDAVLIKYNTICPFALRSAIDAYACLGKTVSFTNYVTGNNLSRQWKFNGNTISNGATYSGVNSDTLTIQSLSHSDTGNYSLEVTRAGCPTLIVSPMRAGVLTGEPLLSAVQIYPMNGNVKSTTGTADAVVSFPATSIYGPSRFGVANKAFSIANTGMSLNIPDVSGARQSYAFWMQPVSGGNALSTLIWNGVNATNRILALNNNVLGTYINNVFTGFGINLPNNQWNHVVFVKDSSRCIVYINGVKRFDSLSLFTSGSITVTELFGQTNWSQGAVGLYDDIRVYNTAIGLDEVVTIYNQIEFQASPRNVSKCIGEQAVLPVYFGNDTALTFQWYKNGVLLNNAGNISQATNDTLLINAGSASDVGYYYAKAIKDCYESISDSIWVTFDNTNLNNGLLSHYTFNGNIIDIVSARNMTTGTPIYGGTNRFGNATNTCLNANNFAVSLSFAPVSADTISVGIWHYPMQSGLRTLISSSNSSASHLVIDANHHVGFRLANGNVISSGVAVTLNTWNHFVITKAGTNQKIYLNGSLIMNVNNSFLNAVTNSALARITNSSNGDSRSFGNYDDMFIYTRELNATEVQALMNRFNTIRNTELVRVCAGSNNTVMLSNTFENTDTTKYSLQWLYNGNPISDGAKYQGVNGDTLMIYNVSAADSGSYTVRITPAQVACANWNTSSARVQLDGPSLINDSLLLYHKYNGNINDQSGRNLTTFSVNTTFATDRFGVVNTTANFDGSLAYIHTPNAIAQNAPRLTVMAWFKANQSTGGIISSVSSLPTTSPISSHALLYIGNDNKLHGKSWNGNSTYMSSPNDVNDNQWHHAALVIEGNNNVQRLYLDGVLVGTIATTNSSLSSTILVGALFGHTTNWFGTNAGWNYFQGQIDEVKVFNKVLSPEEISRIAQSIGFAESGTQQIGFCNNSTAQIIARPQGAGATMQWYKNGVALTNTSNITNVNGDTLRINNITPADTGVYRLMLTRECYSLWSDTIRVGVYSNIVKTQNPANRNVCVNDSVAFVTQALGASLTYQWFKSNTALTNNAKYSGVNSNVLSVRNIQYTETGQYRLRIADACSNVDSTTVVDLTIVPNTPPALPTPAETYAFDGNVNATTNTSNNGINNDITSALNRFNVVNGALNFNSIDSAHAVLPGTLGVSSRLNYTVSLWFRTNSTSTNQGIFGCANVLPSSGNPTNYHPMLYVTSNGNLAGKMYNGNVNSMVSLARVDDGQWHHAILTYASANGLQRLYLDGVLVGNINTGNFTSGTGLLPIVGATYGPSYTGHTNGWSFFNGQIDDVRIYNTYFLNDANVANQLFMKAEFLPATTELVCSGQSQVSIRSGIFGSPAFLQWKRNGIALTDFTKYSGINSDTLTILNFNVSDTGNYVCEFWNGCNNALANNRTVTFGTIPVITAQPSQASSCSGGSVVLSVNATGGGLSYQWRKNGVPLANSGNISGATSAALTISSLSASDTAAYSCVITNTCGTTTSANAHVSLTTGLQILQQPTNKNACLNSNTFLYVVTTDPNATYQWRKDGNNISNSNNDTLFLNNVNTASGGSYSVQITSVCGSATSANATLVITPNIVINQQPQSVEVCEGKSATLTVGITGPALTYQWRKNGSDIIGATASSFTIQSYAQTDAGNYTCVITSLCNTVTTNAAAVSTATSVAVTSQSATNLSLCPNDPNPNVTLFVNTTGSLQGYQWYKDGVAISGANSSSYVFNRTVTAPGIFYCKVFGVCDTVNSSDINYVLQTTPVITDQPTAQSICSGQSLVLTAGIQTDFNPTYRWYKDGVALNNGGNISGAFTDSLVISSTTSADNGLYHLEITLCGSTQSTQSANVVVNNQNTMLAQSPSSVSSCSGQNVSLFVNPSVASSTFQWKKNGNAINGATNDTLIISATSSADNGTYTCDVISACGNLVSSDITLTVNTTPTPTVVQNGAELTTQSYSAYQWRRNGTNIIGANQQNYTPTQSGNYSVSVNSNGCSAISPDFNFTFSNVNELSKSSVNWYPNPAHTHVTIEFNTQQYAVIKLLSIDGKLISTESVNASVHQINVESLTPGMYILVVEVDSKKALFEKFVKQ